jgi:hypothetical protein
MRALLEAAGFRVAVQRRVYRLPAGILLPPVLTVASDPSHSTCAGPALP